VIFRVLFVLSLALFLTACQTTHRFTEPGPGWRTWHGQLKYTNPKRSLIGEVVVSRHGTKDFQLEYMAGPGFPLMLLQQDATTTQAKGALAFGPPGHLKGWSLLRDSFATLPADAHSISVESPKTRERFYFRFAP
jgi:hypothetical protein